MSDAGRLLLIVLAMVLLALCIVAILWIALMFLPWIVGREFSAIHGVMVLLVLGTVIDGAQGRLAKVQDNVTRVRQMLHILNASLSDLDEELRDARTLTDNLEVMVALNSTFAAEYLRTVTEDVLVEALLRQADHETLQKLIRASRRVQELEDG